MPSVLTKQFQGNLLHILGTIFFFIQVKSLLEVDLLSTKNLADRFFPEEMDISRETRQWKRDTNL